jgi:hypothetical protein
VRWGHRLGRELSVGRAIGRAAPEENEEVEQRQGRSDGRPHDTHQKSWSNKKKHARAGHIPCGGEIDGGEPGATIHAIEVVVIDDDGDNDRKRDRRR